MILITGFVTIIMLLIGIVSDVILFGHPISGEKFSNLGLANLLNVSPERLFIGGILGILVMSFGNPKSMLQTTSAGIKKQ